MGIGHSTFYDTPDLHEVPCHLSLFRKGHFNADGEYHRDASLVPRLRVRPTWDMIARRAESPPRLSGGRLSISRPPQFSARYAPKAMLVIRATGHGGDAFVAVQHRDA